MGEFKPQRQFIVGETDFNAAVEKILERYRDDGEPVEREHVEHALGMALSIMVDEIVGDILNQAFGPKSNLFFEEWLAYYQDQARRKGGPS